jgi:hypothetical protein
MFLFLTNNLKPKCNLEPFGVSVERFETTLKFTERMERMGLLLRAALQ